MISGKYIQFKKDFENFLAMKQPNIQDYQYIEDFVQDSMAYYYALCKVAHECPNWLRRREHKLVYVAQAEAYGLPYKTKDFLREIEKYREED